MRRTASRGFFSTSARSPAVNAGRRDHLGTLDAAASASAAVTATS